MEVPMRRILILIFILVLSLCGYFFYHEKNQMKEVNREMFDKVMSEKMETLYAQARNWKQPLKMTVPDDRLEGDYKIMSEFILRYWMDNIEARNSYLRQLDQAQWDEFLNAERLEKDRKASYQQTHQMFNTVRKATTEYEKKHTQIFNQALTDVEALKVDSKMRDAMKEKLLHSHENNDETALLQIELQIIGKAEEMFALLRKNKWLRQGKTFLFAKDAQVRQFNILYAEILEFQAQIDELKRHNAKVFEVQD